MNKPCDGGVLMFSDMIQAQCHQKGCVAITVTSGIQINTWGFHGYVCFGIHWVSLVTG